MLEGGNQLGEAAVDVYADLSRLDADLAEARRKVEKWAADTQAQMGGAVSRAQSGGTLAMPTKQLDDFAAHMSSLLAGVTKQSQAALGAMTQTIDQATTKAASGVGELGKAAESAVKDTKDGMTQLNAVADQLVTNIHKLDAAGEAAASNIQRRATAPARPGASGAAPGRAASAAGREAANDAAELDRAVKQLAQSYSPLHAAQMRYIADLEKIDALQKAGILSNADAQMFTGKASDALRKASDEQSKVYQFAQRAGEQIRQYSGLAVLAFGVAAVAAVRSSMQQVQAIKATSEQLHMSSTAWQEWGFIANQVNVPIGKVEQGFEQLQNVMGRAATGAVAEGKLFKELGISLTDTNGKAKDTNAIMRELADTLPRVADENQRAAAMQKLFGQNAAEFSKLLAGGSGEINRLAESAHNLGVVLSEEEIRNVDQTAQKMEDLKNVLAADVSRQVANNAASIISLASALSQLTGAIIGFLGSNPQAALGLLGALAGARIAGPYGALVGGVGGAIAGGRMQQNQEDANKDLVFRSNRMQGASRNLREYSTSAFKRITDPTGYSMAKQAFEEQRQLFGGAVLNKFQEGQRGLRGNKPASASGPPISLSNLNAPKPAAGRHAKTPAARPDGYEKEMAALEVQLLQAMGAQVTNAADRAKIDLAILDADKRRYNAGIDMQVQTKRFTAAEGDLLKAKYAEVNAVKRLEVEHRKEDQQLKDRTAIGAASMESRQAMLGAEKQLARTTGKRRTIELELLDLTTKMEAAQLDATIAAHDSSDTEKEIAAERKKHLAELKGLQRQIILRETQGPVADFFDKIPKTAEEIDEAVKRIRASNLEDLQQRTVNFADSIGDAFGNMTRNIFALQSPMKILQSLLADLANTFVEETVVRPVKDWATRKIGGPAAERFVGGTAGPEGLSAKALENSSLQAATKVDAMALAAMRAEQALNAIGAGSAVSGARGALSPLAAATGAANDIGMSVADPLKSLGDRAFDASDALAKATSAANDMGRSLPNVIQQLLASTSGGGGGGGGLLQTVLGVAGMVAGSTSFAGGSAKAALKIGSSAVGGSVIGGAGAAMKMFKRDGGYLGGFKKGGGLLIGPGTGRSDSIPAVGPRGKTAMFSDGEYILNSDATARIGVNNLDKINAGRIPSLNGMGMQSFSSVDRSTHIRLGDVIVQGGGDDRSARRTGKQVGAAQSQVISRAAKQGIIYRD